MGALMSVLIPMGVLVMSVLSFFIMRGFLGSWRKPSSTARKIGPTKTVKYKAKKLDPLRAAYAATPVPLTDEDADDIPTLVIPKNLMQNKDKFYYGVRIVNGVQEGAADIILSSTYISLIGDKGEARNIQVKAATNPETFKSMLLTKFNKRFRSTYDDVIIESDEDLGEIQVIHARLDCMINKPFDWLFNWLFNRLKPQDFFVKADKTLPQRIYGFIYRLFTVAYNCYNLLLQQNWFISYFTVAYLENEATIDFPCYHWVGQNERHCVEATSKTATLAQISGNKILSDQRSDLLKRRRKSYKWKMFTDRSSPLPQGIPSCIDTKSVEKRGQLPLDEQFEWAKTTNFTLNGICGKFTTFGMQVRIKLMQWARSIFLLVHFDTGFHDFEFISKGLEKHAQNRVGPRKEIKWPTNEENHILPACHEGHRWITDIEFGRQMLNGVNPIVIRKCTEVPEFVRNEKVKNRINALLSQRKLEDEIENNRVYICNLRDILDGLYTREGYHCAAPVCLLYVNDSDQLIPIAMQLMKDDPVILPSDGWFKWVLAKMHYQAADAQYHQISSHFISCHATMEAYCVATMRNIPDAHPLYKLLQPHFHNTLSINEQARDRLISKDGQIAKNFAVGNDGMFQLFERAGTAHRVHWTNIKHSIKKRGVENLPGYYYRDDGLEIWDAIETYVTDIIDLFYKNDEDVVKDSEVQDWAKEIHDKAFPEFDEAPQGHGFPKEMKTKNELIEVCTLIIFTGSAQHAAVNFGQFDMYGYAPNKPIGMRERPPNGNSKIDHQSDLMRHLPDIKTATQAAFVTFLLAQFSPDEIFLGEYPHRWYTEEPAIKAVEKFGKTLKELDKKIVKRNKSLDVPYYHLRPTRVPNSISI